MLSRLRSVDFFIWTSMSKVGYKAIYATIDEDTIRISMGVSILKPENWVMKTLKDT